MINRELAHIRDGLVGRIFLSGVNFRDMDRFMQSLFAYSQESLKLQGLHPTEFDSDKESSRAIENMLNACLLRIAEEAKGYYGNFNGVFVEDNGFGFKVMNGEFDLALLKGVVGTYRQEYGKKTDPEMPYVFSVVSSEGIIRERIDAVCAMVNGLDHRLNGLWKKVSDSFARNRPKYVRYPKEDRVH